MKVTHDKFFYKYNLFHNCDFSNSEVEYIIKKFNNHNILLIGHGYSNDPPYKSIIINRYPNDKRNDINISINKREDDWFLTQIFNNDHSNKYNTKYEILDGFDQVKSFIKRCLLEYGKSCYKK